MRSAPDVLAMKARRGAGLAHKAEETTNRIACPCGKGNLRNTKDSRPGVIGDNGTEIIRRRRVCDACGERHTTIEISEFSLRAYHREIMKSLAMRLIEGM